MKADKGLWIKKAWIIPLFWLFTQGFFSLIRFDDYNPIIILVVVFFLALCLYPTKMIYNADPFNAFLLFFLLLQIIEIIQCTIIFKQSIIVTLRRLVWVSPYILYYPIRYIISKDKEWIQKKIIQIGTIACIIGITLYFNRNLLNFFSADIGIRDGETFVYFGNKLPLISVILIISELFKNTEKRKLHLILILGLHLFDFVYVMRYRGQMIGVLVALCVAFGLTTGISKTKKALIVILGIIILTLTDNALQTAILNLIEQVKMGSSTAGVRFEGYEIVLSQCKDHIIAGYGGNLLARENNALFGIGGVALSDLGIVGWLYKYGLIGLLFYCYYIFLLIKYSSVRIDGKRQLNYIAVCYAGYSISTIMTIVTLDTYYKGNLYVNIFMLALISQEYMDLENRNRKELV